MRTWWFSLGTFAHESLDRPVGFARTYDDDARWFVVTLTTTATTLTG